MFRGIILLLLLSGFLSTYSQPDTLIYKCVSFINFTPDRSSVNEVVRIRRNMDTLYLQIQSPKLWNNRLRVVSDAKGVRIKWLEPVEGSDGKFWPLIFILEDSIEYLKVPLEVRLEVKEKLVKPIANENLPIYSPQTGRVINKNVSWESVPADFLYSTHTLLYRKPR